MSSPPILLKIAPKSPNWIRPCSSRSPTKTTRIKPARLAVKTTTKMCSCTVMVVKSCGIHIVSIYKRCLMATGSVIIVERNATSTRGSRAFLEQAGLAVAVLVVSSVGNAATSQAGIKCGRQYGHASTSTWIFPMRRTSHRQHI